MFTVVLVRWFVRMHLDVFVLITSTLSMALHHTFYDKCTIVGTTHRVYISSCMLRTGRYYLWTLCFIVTLIWGHDVLKLFEFLFDCFSLPTIIFPCDCPEWTANTMPGIPRVHGRRLPGKDCPEFTGEDCPEFTGEVNSQYVGAQCGLTPRLPC